tara:strand:- start:2233 stop:2868 length:636 start_codon:yes stop_codon:yes gene_type:complete
MGNGINLKIYKIYFQTTKSVFSMRIFLIVFILLWGIQSFSKADNISEFEIEGMSIGNSALDFFSKVKINKSQQNYYNDDEFIPVYIKNNSFKDYEGVQFHYKKKDKKYKFVALEGVLFLGKKKANCYNKQDEIFNDLKEIFPAAKIDEYEGKHAQDKSGKSTFRTIEFFLKDGSITIDCYFWDKEMGYTNNLRVSILKKSFLDWVDNKAYN